MWVGVTITMARQDSRAGVHGEGGLTAQCRLSKPEWSKADVYTRQQRWWWWPIKKPLGVRRASGKDREAEATAWGGGQAGCRGY